MFLDELTSRLTMTKFLLRSTISFDSANLVLRSAKGSYITQITACNDDYHNNNNSFTLMSGFMEPSGLMRRLCKSNHKISFN